MFVEMSPSGGLFQYGYQLGSQLARAGHRVEIVTGPDPELASREPNLTISAVLPTWHADEGEDTPQWIRRVRRPARGILHVMALVRLLGMIGRQRPDAVFFQPLRFPLDAWAVQICRLISPSTTRCIVLHETRPLAEQRRDGSLYREERLHDRWLQDATRRSIRRMQKIFVLGEAARDDALERWNPRAPLTVIPHGDEDVFLDLSHVPAVELTDPN